MKRKCPDGDVPFNAEDGICQVNIDIFAFTFDWCESSFTLALHRGGGYLLRGDVCSEGMSALGGVCSGGCLLLVGRGGCTWSQGVYLVLGGVPGPGGTWSQGVGVDLVPEGVYLVPGVGGVPAQVPPLWTEFLTHAYENITLPQTSFAGGNNSFSHSSLDLAHSLWKILDPPLLKIHPI